MKPRTGKVKVHFQKKLKHIFLVKKWQSPELTTTVRITRSLVFQALQSEMATQVKRMAKRLVDEFGVTIYVEQSAKVRHRNRVI